jgi:hypothetical protein
MYFQGTVKRAGGIGKSSHRREVTPAHDQAGIRANRDTLYSSAVFDLEAGPVPITLPGYELLPLNPLKGTWQFSSLINFFCSAYILPILRSSKSPLGDLGAGVDKTKDL